jgi:hypothetical protein
VSSRGVLFVHSVPAALCPHVEWAISAVLRVPADLVWAPQPVQPGTFRTEADWRGPAGTAARITSALARWPHLRFEVTEHATVGYEGERYLSTPTLGVVRTVMGPTGEVYVGEQQLRALMDSATDAASLRIGMDRLLAGPWDAELEPFRHAGEGAPVRWLTATG